MSDDDDSMVFDLKKIVKFRNIQKKNAIGRILQQAYKRYKAENKIEKWPDPIITNGLPEKCEKSYILFDDDPNKNLIEFLKQESNYSDKTSDNIKYKQPRHKLNNVVKKRNIKSRASRSGKFLNKLS